MRILQHFSLKKLNSFGLEVFAENFVAVDTAEALQASLRTGLPGIRILGGGSNILLTSDVGGLVIHNRIGGIEIQAETDDYAIVCAGGGENWHCFVCRCLDLGLFGIENLSLIPGTVGAAPIQNIGAYGVELKDVFHRLEAVELQTGKVLSFRTEDCHFGYRDSVFKNEFKDKLCITKVFLKLSKHPKVNTSYGDIQRTLEGKGIKNPTPKDVGEAVIHIRRSKLPDPAELGNAGSFFKNPEIEAAHFQQLQAEFPHIVHYRLANGKVKIPAGWLIEQAGWKGKRFGDAGCHARQALVLVNYGKATGKEIENLARQIQATIVEKFGIPLTPEVNVWG
jgi:UDP-N-acetylmuramate dehydrogenase